MAIRFACPSCRQPIEVDDPWGGQSVACPYCRQVVTAPSSSSWPASEIPMASPASPAFAPPPPPVGTAAPTPTPSTAHSQAPWALTLALSGAVLSIVGWLAYLGPLFGLVLEKAGPNASKEQIDEVVRDIAASGQAQAMNATTLLIFLVGAICSISGLVLAVRSLLRLHERRGLAIAACIISVCFLVCQILPMLAALTAHQAASAS